MKNQSKIENVIYLVLWLLMFIAPVMTLYIRTSSTLNGTMDWSEVAFVWKQYLPYLLIFLIHNFLLAPLLIFKQKKLRYFGSVIILLALFQTYQCNSKPSLPQEGMKPLHERAEGHGPMDGPMDDGFGPMDWDDHRPDDGPFGHDAFRDEPPHERKHPEMEHGPKPLLGLPELIAAIIAMLMIGVNLGIKLYFKTRNDSKNLAELEKQSLERQLEYLKYQINPHFFMNTLNNIHALVDIDPEKAKATIVELSKMMRFVLYEGNKKGVPLNREIAFLHNYITLMKLRYTDKVRISVDTPQSMPDKQIPPLMLITFVENSFKHGVSYQKESFIDIAVTIIGDRLRFTCRNSKIAASEDKHGGVGLTNVKERLNLIYGNNFTLDIKDEAETYSVDLTIPLL